MAAFDWLQQMLGGAPDQGAPMVVQNRAGGFDPYRPAPVPDALSLLSDLTGLLGASDQ